MTEQALAYQEQALQGVSRTFALTIPLLPPHLRQTVGTAYLLCRIADTIEDSDALTQHEKEYFSQAFIELTASAGPGDEFARELEPMLTGATLPAERELVARTPEIMVLFQSYDAAEQQAMARCIRIMCEGMAHFTQERYHRGLPDLPAMEKYCYHVAGVVGEMLTELFCAYSPQVAKHREFLFGMAPRFGCALQMTNILKDIWEDKQRDACWLPQDVFRRNAFNLAAMGAANPASPAFDKALSELVAVALTNLQQAVAYTTALPRAERGLREFCFLPIFLAVMTLERIHANPGFTSGEQVKIARDSVRKAMTVIKTCSRSNWLMRAAFRWYAAGLPRR